MTSSTPFPRWQKWLLLYSGAFALGAGLLFSGQFLPPSWFADWNWWQRLALIAVTGPIVVAAYLAAAVALEAVVHAVLLALRHFPFPTIVVILALIGIILVMRDLFAST